MVSPPFSLKDIKPGEFSYISRRKLEDKNGEIKGEIFLWKRPDEEDHSFVLECPYCQKEGEGTVSLKRRPYRIRCASCEKSITLKKLKNVK
jgi:hypothetical protein